jgi:ElaB/YqjD/DUF883 family membrane-anchored ribosome-binding protein
MLERTAAQSAALAEELRNVMRQAEKLVVALSEDKDAALIELRERVSAALGTAQERIAEFETQARRLKDTAAPVVDEYVRENPWTVVSVAAALGLLMGAWLASGSRSAEPDPEEP